MRSPSRRQTANQASSCRGCAWSIRRWRHTRWECARLQQQGPDPPCAVDDLNDPSPGNDRAKSRKKRSGTSWTRHRHCSRLADPHSNPAQTKSHQPDSEHHVHPHLHSRQPGSSAAPSVSSESTRRLRQRRTQNRELPQVDVQVRSNHNAMQYAQDGVRKTFMPKSSLRTTETRATTLVEGRLVTSISSIILLTVHFGRTEHQVTRNRPSTQANSSHSFAWLRFSALHETCRLGNCSRSCVQSLAASRVQHAMRNVTVKSREGRQSMRTATLQSRSGQLKY